MFFSIWEQVLLLRGYIFPLATCSCRLHWATVCLFTDQWQWRESQVHCGLVPFPPFSWQMVSTKTVVNNPHSKCLAAQAFTEIASSFCQLNLKYAWTVWACLPWANRVLLAVPQALGAEKPSGIHVFAVLLHAHLAGRGIRLRHFRHGEEMQSLAYDDDFDFNFQEFQYLKEEQTILPVGMHTLCQKMLCLEADLPGCSRDPARQENCSSSS